VGEKEEQADEDEGRAGKDCSEEEVCWIITDHFDMLRKMNVVVEQRASS